MSIYDRRTHYISGFKPVNSDIQVQSQPARRGHTSSLLSVPQIQLLRPPTITDQGPNSKNTMVFWPKLYSAQAILGSKHLHWSDAGLDTTSSRQFHIYTTISSQHAPNRWWLRRDLQHTHIFHRCNFNIIHPLLLGLPTGSFPNAKQVYLEFKRTFPSYVPFLLLSINFLSTVNELLENGGQHSTLSVFH